MKTFLLIGHQSNLEYTRMTLAIGYLLLKPIAFAEFVSLVQKLLKNSGGIFSKKVMRISDRRYSALDPKPVYRKLSSNHIPSPII